MSQPEVVAEPNPSSVPQDLLSHWFSEQGLLASALPGYTPRESQQRMAEAVAAAIDARQTLIVEAGTGIGKSLAYLVPALLSGRRLLVSTGTRNLQDQLFHKDLPILLKHLNRPCQVGLLKGRSNYLCQHRLEQTRSSARLHDKRQVKLLRDIVDWSVRTDTGELSEVGDSGDGSPVWRMVSSTTDNCLGSDCSFYDQCHVLRARKRAQEADIVIINHHLLMADMALRESSFGELLPSVDAIVVDEAHQLPGIASDFFGQRMSFHQLNDLITDARAAHVALGSDMPELDACLTELGRCNEQLVMRLSGPPSRMPWSEAQQLEAADVALTGLGSAFNEVVSYLGKVADRSKELQACHERSQLLQQLLDCLNEDNPERVRWLERTPRSYTLHVTPLDISSQFTAQVQATAAAWVMTSATLTVNGEFEHFSKQLGLGDAKTLALASPFDYPRQAVLYAPDNLPNPNESGYMDAIVSAMLPVIRASQGGAFVLCTSLRAVDEISAVLSQQLEQHIYTQGEDSRLRLLQAFSEDGNGVLVATSSFWEGVDVRGSALRLVIIDRLPFTPPDDPVLQSRVRQYREAGENAFMQVQLPEAVIGLKQGVGRLIRSETDRGVVMICDPRLRGKQYGRIFLESLPPMTRSSRLEVVERFYAVNTTEVPTIQSPESA